MQIPTLVVIFLWATSSFATAPALQTRVVDKASEAPNLASTLNIGAFNLGNAGGAFLGGLVLDRGFALPAVPVAGAVVALVALGLAAVGMMRDRREVAAAPLGERGAAAVPAAAVVAEGLGAVVGDRDGVLELDEAAARDGGWSSRSRSPCPASSGRSAS